MIFAFQIRLYQFSKRIKIVFIIRHKSLLFIKIQNELHLPPKESYHSLTEKLEIQNLSIYQKLIKYSEILVYWSK